MTMKKQSGFTLIELLMAIVIAAMVLAIGVPSLGDFIKKNRIVLVTNELVSALHVARSEAIRQNSVSCFCSSANANAAVPICSGSAAWENGWISFLDQNGNCAIDGPADVLLKAWDGSSYAGMLTIGNANASILAAGNTVLFNSRGEPRWNNRFQQGSFTICDDRGVVMDNNNNSITATAVILSPSGSARSSRSSAQVACP